MFVLSNFLQALASILNTVLTIYFWIIIVSAVLSWVNPDPYNPIVRIINNMTQPAFNLIRRWLPFSVIGGLDLSPIVLLLAIQFVKIFVVQTLFQMGAYM